MPSVLDGFRVLEVVDSIAGQSLGQLLVDQGADVLKIEPPEGDSWRGRPQFHVWNRGKRSATADLAVEPGRKTVLDLARRSDIVITDQGPSVSKELGLGYDDLANGNPGLIHAWLPPYGAEGPLADLPPDDALAEALGGSLASQVSAEGHPMLLTIPLASYATAMLAASAVCAAALVRERDGWGQQVTVSWLAGALALHTGALVKGTGGKSILGGAARARMPQGAFGAYKLYKAKDDRWLFLPCGNNTFYNKMLAAIDRADLLAEERFQDGPWGLKPEVQKELREIIAPIIAAKPREYWLHYFDEQDVPVAPVLSRESFIDDPQVIHNGLRLELDDPTLGRVVMAGVPIDFEATPGGVTAPAPVLGDSAELALESWPQRDVAMAAPEPQTAGPPLAGVRVVDLTSYIAGSLCPMILADYGADVIKVESLEGDAFRAFGLGFLGWNRGKRGVALDLKSVDGREVLYDLVRRADVVVENFRAGVPKRIGADYESLRHVNPKIVYCSIPGWGESGPYTGKPVFDPIFQARSGAQQAQGGDGDPVFFVVAITDYAAAHLTAYAATAGLLARERTGAGQKVSVTLAGATMAAQSGEFIFPAIGGSFGHAMKGGSDFPGTSAAYRSYHCSDGWLFIACTREEHWHAMSRAIGRPEFAYPNSWQAVSETDVHGGVADEIASMLAEDTVESWMSRLSTRGVPCAPVVELADTLAHPQAVANDYEATHRHEKWGDVRQTGVLAKFSRTPGVAQRVGPMLGEHTDDILEELGYGSERIAGLRKSRAIL